MTGTYKDILDAYDAICEDQRKLASKEEELNDMVEKLIEAYDDVRDKWIHLEETCNRAIEDYDVSGEEIISVQNCIGNIRFFLRNYKGASEMLKKTQYDLLHALY